MHILQDTKGFIWFATWDGIYKFDGYHLKITKTEKGIIMDSITAE